MQKSVEIFSKMVEVLTSRYFGPVKKINKECVESNWTHDDDNNNDNDDNDGGDEYCLM